MSKQVQFRRGTTAEHATFKGAVGEITIDIEKDVVVVHDNIKMGGHPLLKEEVLTDMFPKNQGSHNGIYRGKFLGAAVTAGQYEAISSGTFEGLYIGDYWTIGGVNYRIAAFDYFYRCGDVDLLTHHAVIVPDAPLYAAKMNLTDITTGGYVGSAMRTANMASAITTIKSAFGAHVLKHKQLLSNSAVSGKASGWAWFESEVELMNEVMVYGSIAFGQSDLGGSGYNLGVSKSQLPLFTFRPDLISNRADFWLRDVVSAAYFAYVYYNGSADASNASFALGVRPAFSIS